MSTTEFDPGAAADREPRVFSRREFLRLFGAGVVVCFAAGSLPEPAEAQERRAAAPSDFNAYLHVGADGRVTVFTGKIEMGQGIVTSLAQMAAEELGVTLAMTDMVLGDTDRCPFDAGTWGSMSTRFFGPALRAAAAEARGVLLELAAERLGVPVEKLVVEAGVVHVAGDSSRRVLYGELAKGEAITRHLASPPALRSPAQWTVCGHDVPRTDGVAKVTGAAQYAGDLRRPGMLHARVLLPPAHGAKLLHADTSAAAKRPGVTVFDRDGLVAVLHADPEQAEAALAAIDAQWDAPAASFDTDTVFDWLVAHAPAPKDGASKGDLAAGRGMAATRFEHRYECGYGAHAPMEPHTALADVAKGHATVWISTQSPFGSHQALQQALGLAREQVRVITPFLGGGFGGKSGTPLQAIDAAKLSQALGVPVMVAWTRAEEFFHDAFRPAAVVQVDSGLDAAGQVSHWSFDIHAAGDRSAEVLYDFANARVRTFGGWYGGGASVHPFAVGPWRAPGANINVFARESQIDVMAAQAKSDPLEFRLKHLSDERMKHVLRATAERFGWKAGAVPSGRGFGLACGIDAGAYVAMCAEVAVDRASGRVSVKRITCGQDMGQVVHPDGARMQMEGSATMGLGYALSETLRFQGGRILDRNFGTYQLPRFSDVPAIDAFLIPNDALPPQGGGEPAIVPVGAAIGNAIADAVGARLFALPMTPERVLKALKG